jgi:zinc transporter ZupT
MTLLVETLSISVTMILLSALPLFSETIRRHSKFFFLLGTGALSGILLFDLLPDLFEMGGLSSLWGMGVVWIVYSAFHLSHLHHHESSEEHSEIAHAHTDRESHIYLFLSSMIGHCIASGVLLVTSEGLTAGLNRTVFWALLSHKAYESLTVSSILIERQSKTRKALIALAIYAGSLPTGVLLTYRYRSSLTPSIALLVTSLAAGTLLGCLMYDFILPSFAHLKRRRLDSIWILMGLIMTQLMMRVL